MPVYSSAITYLRNWGSGRIWGPVGTVGGLRKARPPPPGRPRSGKECEDFSKISVLSEYRGVLRRGINKNKKRK